MINQQPTPWTSAFIFLVMLLSGFQINAQENQAKQMKPTAYPEEWKVIDSLVNQGLFESALSSVKALYKKAHQDGNEADAVKAIVFQNGLSLELTETPYLDVIENINQKLREANGIPKALLQFMLAEAYNSYLSENYWKLQDQTTVDELSADEDWRNQTPAQFQAKIIELYEAALQEEKLKTTPAGNFSLLWRSESTYVSLRPTLYDIMSHQVINYLKDARSYLTSPRETFDLPDSVYFADLDVFLEQNFTDQEHTSLKATALQLFQSVLRFRKSQDNFPALIDADLHRLLFLYHESNLDQKEALFTQALDRLIKAHGYREGMGFVFLEKAKLIYNEGNAYEVSQGDLPERWKLQEAKKLCEKLIKELPGSAAAAKAKSLIATIIAPSLRIESEQVLLPKELALAKITYRNIPKAYFKIVKFDLQDQLNLPNQGYEDATATIAKLPAIAKWQANLPNSEDHHIRSIETKIPVLAPGQYALVFADQANFKSEEGHLLKYYPFSVSNVAYFWRTNEDGKTEFVLSHRKNGQPLNKVKATFYRYDYSNRSNKSELVEIGKATSDKNGMIKTDLSNRSFIAKFTYGDDVLFVSESFYNSRPYQNERSYSRTSFFLDRAIYRPGQTVYFKGILTLHDPTGENVEILTNEPVRVTFRDANYQEILSRNFTTNEFGTFNGSFEIPPSMLTGSVSIYSDKRGSINFRVEEYKRPKFEVKLDPLEGDYVVNDEVTVSGNAEAFAGSVVDGAKVIYRIQRTDLRPYPWYRYSYIFGYDSNVEIAHGETTTDADGKFSIDFKAIPNPEMPKSMHPRFRYQVSVDVVDITGETRSNSANVTIGYTGMTARLELPTELDRSQDIQPWNIITENHNGSKLEASGSIKIYQLQHPKQPFKTRYWAMPTEQADAEFQKNFPDYTFNGEDDWNNWPKELQSEHTFNTANSTTFQISAEDFPVGYYYVELATKDKAGNDIEFNGKFQVVDSEAKNIPSDLLFWKKVPTQAFEPGDEMEMPIASAKKLFVLLELEQSGKIIRQEWLTVENWNTIDRMIQESDRGNIQVQLSYIYDNRAFTDVSNITVPFTNKELHFEYSTFRDKLRPGQEEEWIIKISGDKKEQVAAEMVATLYDASLDQFAANHWHLNYYNSNFRSRYPWRQRLFSSRGESDAIFNGFNSYDDRSYPELQLFLAPYVMRYQQRMSYSAMSARSAVPELYSADGVEAKTAGAPPPPPPAPGEPEMEEMEVSKDEAVFNDSTVEETPAPPVQVRTNLNETVFFLPNLHTDEEGNVYIKFTMNEALTRWKFLGLAHTKDLKVGTTQQEIVTQKELMVLPNAPRFVREGDLFEFTAKVSNLTEKDMEGTATIEFFDPLTQKEVTTQVLKAENSVQFLAKAGQSDRLGWTIQIPFGQLNALTYRIIARSESFSDGEENSVPVVTNRTLVTETMPISLRGKQSKTLDFAAVKESLKSSTAQGHLFQVEFTSNPVWLAVKSMPYLMEFPYECSEQIFNRFFANTVSKSILDSHPRIQEVFASWENTDALKSQLEKHQALKSALLEETPWVMDAQSEATQREQIALLFDLDRLATEQASTLDKLIIRQGSEGGFAWFDGGYSNWYITNYILAGFGHLQSLNAIDDEQRKKISIVISKALNYADSELVNRHERLKALAKDGKIKLEDNHLSPAVIHYLYAKSFFTSMETTANEQEAIEYYLGQAQKYWLQTDLLQQAQIGLIGQRMDLKPLSQKILASLKERALESEELGMYWKYQSGYFWYESPIETHTALMEFFAEMGEEEMLNELKIWLLKNKQTNAWPTTKTTAEAIWALLRTSDGSNPLMEEELVDIKFPDLSKSNYADKLEAAQASAEKGTGQFEVKWKGEEIKSDLSTIKVKNPNKQIAWGAAYWQYFEDLDKVKVFKETPLKMEKELYLTKNTDEGPKLFAVTPNIKLHPGDLITVRIKLAVDRDMDFVHMKDMRASGLEPVNVISRYKWQGGLGYYESTKDLATHFFFDYLPKGNYVFEYPLRVQLNGDFSNGICTIQSMYAPEFTSHSNGIRINVTEE